MKETDKVKPAPISRTGDGEDAYGTEPDILEVLRRLKLLAGSVVATGSWAGLPFKSAQLQAEKMRSDL